MKKLLLAVLLVLAISLSACSLGQYFPASNQSPVITLNDSFLFTEDSVNQEVTPNAQDNVSEDNTVIILDGENEEEVIAEPEEDLSDVGVLTTISVVEGETASLSFLSAQDPDGDSIRYSYSEPFNTMGEWTTKDGDAGDHLVQVTASDGLLSTTETVRVTVTPSNKGPVIDCPNSFSVNEGDVIELPCTIVDMEGDEVIYSITGYMTSFKKQTTFDDAGTYEVTITANDGNKKTTKTLELIIADVNRAPVLAEDSADGLSYTVVEGDFVVITLDVNDPDGDALEITYPILFDESGVWETKRGDAGNYELEAQVTDGNAVLKVPIEIVVEKLNLAPTLAHIDDVVVSEGETISLPVDAEDADGDALAITYSGFMTSESYTTTYDDAGEYEVTITVKDATHTVTQTVGITVENSNRPPVFVVA